MLKIENNKLYFGTNTKSTNLRIHELLIVNQTTKIDTHEEKYFHSIQMLSFCDKFVCNSYASLVYHSLIFYFCEVIVSVLDFIVIDLVRSTQFTNKRCICCFFTKSAAFRNK